MFLCLRIVPPGVWLSSNYQLRLIIVELEDPDNSLIRNCWTLSAIVFSDIGHVPLLWLAFHLTVLEAQLKVMVRCLQYPLNISTQFTLLANGVLYNLCLECLDRESIEPLLFSPFSTSRQLYKPALWASSGHVASGSFIALCTIHIFCGINLV